MFSGIVEEKGTVHKIEHKKNLAILHVKGEKVVRGTKDGDSISNDGVCLTMTSIKNKIMTFDIMLETLKKTTLGKLRKGSKINLERALKMSSRISGHFVSGHVDDLAKVIKIKTMENYVELQISLAKELHRYLVPKGSVTINGVSLTVGEVRKTSFSVYLIPFTLEVTNLGLLKKGDYVNIETDILAKYIFAQGGASRSGYGLSPDDPLIKSV